jgi:hypothetical protein
MAGARRAEVEGLVAYGPEHPEASWEDVGTEPLVAASDTEADGAMLGWPLGMHVVEGGVG